MSLGEASATDTLGNLQGKGDKFTKLALIERKKMQDLQDAINYIMSETHKYRDLAKKSAIDVMNIHVLTPNPAYSRADGVNIGREAQVVTSKTLNVLEAKLNKLLQRKSEIQNQIKKLKETINHYRLVRMQTDDSHARYEQVLAETKEKIESILAESTKVVEEREKILEKKDQLERINVEEQKQFQDEYEEMGRFVKLQNDALENSLLQERKADRNGTTLQKSTGAPGGGNGNSVDGLNIASDLSLEEEVEMAKKVGTLNSFMNQEQSSLSELREKIASYETMFEQLKKMTGVESLEDMVSNYIAHEEEMFSLYNFIQTVNAEIDTVLETTQQTEQAIFQFKEDQQDQDQQRRSTIDELQQRLASMLEMTNQLVDSNAVQQESVSQISKKVSSVFFKLQCDQMEAKGSQVSKSQRWGSNAGGGGARQDGKIALLTGQGVTESNVLDYLGCIEQRAVDIISEYLRVMSKDGNNPLLATNNANANNNSNRLLHQTITSGIRSPTPGPSTPMNWQRRQPTVDLGEISDDDFFQAFEPGAGAGVGVGGMVNNLTVITNNNTLANSGAAGGVGAGGFVFPSSLDNNKDTLNTNNNVLDDNKPVDLNAFKSKLQKKLGLKESASTPNFLGSTGGTRK